MPMIFRSRPPPHHVRKLEARERRNPVRDRNRWIALVVLCTGMVMIVVDGTNVNITLPVA